MPSTYILINDGVLEDGRPLAGSTLRTIRDNAARLELGNGNGTDKPSPIVISTNETTRSSNNGSAQEQTVNFTWQAFAPPENKYFINCLRPSNFNVRFGTTTAPPDGATISIVEPTSEFPDNGTFSFSSTTIPRTGNPSIPNFMSGSFNQIIVFADRLLVPNGSMRQRFVMGGGQYSASVIQSFEIVPIYGDLGGLRR